MTWFRGLQLSLLGALLLPAMLALDVVELTEENFPTVVDGSRNVLVMFYTQDCGHCKVMEPEYEAAAEILVGGDDILLARLDSDAETDVADEFEIDGAPIFKWFPKGRTDPDPFYYVHYAGRMGNTLLRMLGERVDGFSKKLPPMKEYVTKLSADNFDSVVFDGTKHVLCYLYSPFGERQDITLALDQVGKAFDGDDIRLAKLPIERVYERDIADMYDIKDYPGWIYVSPAGKWEHFTGEPDALTIAAFLNTKANLQRTIKGKLARGAGKVMEMEPFAGKPINADTIVEANAVLEGLQGVAADNGKHYVKVMERILDKGPGYVKTELKRLESMLGKDGISNEKKNLFSIRSSILDSFNKFHSTEGEL